MLSIKGKLTYVTNPRDKKHTDRPNLLLDRHEKKNTLNDISYNVVTFHSRAINALEIDANQKGVFMHHGVCSVLN